MGVIAFNPLCAALAVKEPESKFLIILVFLFFMLSVSISFSPSEKKEKKVKEKKVEKVETPEKSEPPPPPLKPAPTLSDQEKEDLQRFKDRLKGKKKKGPLTVEDITSFIKKDDTFKEHTITNISMAYSLKEFRKTGEDFIIVKGSKKRGGCVAITLRNNTEKEVFILG
jgi:hypothetical protein